MTSALLHRVRVLAVALVPLTCLSVPPAHADDRPAPERRTITVTGHGEVTAAPDRAALSVAVETTAPAAADAAKDNARRSTAVSAAVQRLTGKDDTLTTTGYSLEPRYDYPKRGETSEPRIVGYVARNQVAVETRKIDAVGELIDAAIRAGANRVESVQFTLSDRTDALRRALQQAGSQARVQADSIAKALGVTLKGVVSATTTSPPIVQPKYMARAMAAAEAAPAPPPPIEPGDVTVATTLVVTYEIE
jgi:uncharacterized protein